MRTICTRSIITVLAISFGLLYGQTTTYSSIVSTYPVTTPPGFTGQVFSTLSLTVYYPAGLPTSSYVTGSQLNSDFQGFLSSYPSPTDAPEAYLSVALQGILNKYSSITGGILSAAITGPPQMIGGITIPGTGTPIGSINIEIGTFSSASTTIVGTGQSVSVSAISSAYTITMPSGFAGQAFSALELGVYYPTGLPSSSYIPISQLSSDFQGFISSYPTPTDPPEAYLSGALQAILNKRTSIPGGTLSASISGPPQMIQGISIPGTGTQIGSIEVAIGNFSAALGSIVYALLGQSGTISIVASSWAVTTPSGFTGQNFSSLQLGVAYPTGLAPGMYITNTQLNSDFQASINAYPNPADAPEAYLSIALQSILNKYSQIPGGSLDAEIAGQGTSIGGITLPGAPAGSISVTIGNYNPAFGTLGELAFLGILDRTASQDAVKRLTPLKPVRPASRPILPASR